MMTATIVELVKYHGLGNDFLVALDGGRWIDSAPDLARATCDRHRGIGADGLLLVLAVPAASDSTMASVRMRLHNADGTLAEMSGNGIRCFVQACVDAGIVDAGRVTVATDAGHRVVEATPSDTAGRAEISVAMGIARLDAYAVLGDLPGRAVTVDVGNPHVVVETGEREMAMWGPRVEQPYLRSATNGINVEFVTMVEAGTVDMAVWERGVGITQACGTGATATAAAARRWGWDKDGQVTVRQPGGSARVVFAGDSATLIGPSQRVASVTFEWNR